MALASKSKYCRNNNSVLIPNPWARGVWGAVAVVRTDFLSCDGKPRWQSLNSYTCVLLKIIVLCSVFFIRRGEATILGMGYIRMALCTARRATSVSSYPMSHWEEDYKVTLKKF